LITKRLTDRKLNPFNLKNYGINFFSLYVDGIQILSRPLQPNFLRDEPLYVKTYHTLFSGTGIHFLNEGNSISRDDYSRGFSLFTFDFTPDQSANCAGYWNLVKYGSLRLEVRFEKPLTTTINCIVCMPSLIMFWKSTPLDKSLSIFPVRFYIKVT